MGKHYVPQAHLRRFQIDEKPNFIWMYDKQTGQFSQAAISKVAQQADFYSQEIEKALAQVVEHPGNAIIEKMLRRERLDNAERTLLSLYMEIMTTRGPRQRKKSLALVPTVLDSVVVETRSQIEGWIHENGNDIELAQARLKEVEVVREKFSKEVPHQILDQIRVPFWSEQTVECIHNMTWHIFPAPQSKYFVTSDTPAHFFEELGLGNTDSEFTFPISKDFALIGEHHHRCGIVFEKPAAQLAKEVNRRVLSYSERFVFSPKREAWIATVTQKTNPFLSLIRWK